MSIVATPPATTTRTTGRLWFWLGLAATVLGIAGYWVQFLVFKQLGSTPWYAAVLATLGAALMLVSIGKRRTVPRMLGLVLLTLVAGFVWFFLLSVTKLPQYTGPGAGEKLAPFQAALTSGEPFTNAELANGSPTVLVFFRGRW